MRKTIILIAVLLFTINVCKAEKNPACLIETKALIFQVLDKGYLAFICPRFNFEYDTITACKLNGTLVYLNFNDNFVDNQLIRLDKNKCFISGGVYRYPNKEGYIKTVREIGIDNKYINYTEN